MPSARALQRRARLELSRHRESALVVARALDGVGAHTVSDHVYRLGGERDIVVVDLPAGRTDLRASRVLMWGHRERDQIARALRDGFRHFEPPMPEVFLSEVRARKGSVYDVGANTGLYSLLAAAAGARDVIAFEPYPPVLDLLRRNLALNRRRRRIHVVARAVGAAPGVGTLYIPPPSPNDAIETSASLSSTFKPEVAEEVVVEVITLDDHWRAAGSGAVGVVKVDVESREADVLDGARDLLATARPLVFFELLPGGDPERIQALADGLDYVDGFLAPGRVVFGLPVAHHPDAWNHVLVPRETLRATADRLGDLRMVVTMPPA